MTTRAERVLARLVQEFDSPAELMQELDISWEDFMDNVYLGLVDEIADLLADRSELQDTLDADPYANE